MNRKFKKIYQSIKKGKLKIKTIKKNGDLIELDADKGVVKVIK